MKILCACGCGQYREELDSQGRKRKYIYRHAVPAWNKGMKGINANEKNGQWKGDKVRYSCLHKWVRRKLGSPRICDDCGTKEAKKYNWANKSGKYKRDLSDWKRLCKKCHNIFDDVYKKMWVTRRMKAL